VVGINENNEIARAAAYDSHLGSLNEVRRMMLEDRDLMLGWQRYLAGEAEHLGEIDRMRLEYQLNILWADYEKAYYGYRYGIVGDSEWTRFERLICTNAGRLRGNDLKEVVEPQLTGDFNAYVERTCVE